MTDGEAWIHPSTTVTRAETTLILPFLHRFSFNDVSRADVADIEGWRHWFSRLAVGTDYSGYRRAVDASYFFLPQVRRFLFPDCELLDRCDSVGVALQRMNDQEFEPRYVRAISSQGGQESFGATLRLTLPLERKLLSFEDHPREAVAFRINWIDSILFPQHIGALMINLSLEAPSSVGHFANLLRHLRKNKTRARLAVASPEVQDLDTGESFSWSSFVAQPLGVLKSTRDYDTHLVEETIGTTFKSVVFASFSLSEPGSSKAPFRDELEAATFSLATGHTLNGLHDVYTEDGMTKLRDSSIQTWDNMRVFGYDEGLCFGLLGGDDDQKRDAERVALVLEWNWALSHALAVVQYARLNLLFQRFVSVSTSYEKAVGEVEEFELEFVRFRRLLWFPVVTSAPVGAPVYALSRRCMDIPALQAWLESDVGLIRFHISSRRERAEVSASRRTGTVLGLLTFVAVPVGLAISIVQAGLWEENVKPLLERVEIEPWEAVVSTGFILFVAYLVLMFATRTSNSGGTEV